jgi:predicted dehydrogenase
LGVGAAAAGAIFGVRRSWGQSPNETLRVASVGVGNMGWGDLTSVAADPKVRIVGLCDVDSNSLGKAAEAFPQAKTFRDFRRMFDELHGEIDAVTVSTPDHMHGSVALAAMSLDKHVYVQKPLAHNLAELRLMCKTAADKGVVTQMGTQIHGAEAYRTAARALQQGVIGKVSEVHLHVDRNWSGPMKRPAGVKPPANLDWDLWLGVAPERPYAPEVYHPMAWRGWRDFGTGSLGDMGCHLFDPIFTGLGLAAPIEVVSHGPQHGAETFAENEEVVYTFAGTPLTADRVTFRWTDGRAQRAVEKAQLPAGMALPGGGSFVVGEKGVMLLPHWAMPTFYSKGEPLEVNVEPAGSVDHYQEWTHACRGEGQASTPFSYSGPVTEAVLVGTLAGHFPNQPLKWNSADLAFDDPAATELVHRRYRQGWEIPQLS